MAVLRMSDSRFTWGIVAAAALAIFGSGAADASVWLHYIFKPLTTALIFLIALGTRDPVSVRYRSAVLIGIVMSLCGDIFLMLPKSVTSSGFLLGLGSFLIAHLFFLRALTTDTRLFARPLVLAAFLLLALGNLLVLWPGLADGLKIPVVAYMFCLVAMTSQAVIRFLQQRTAASKMAALGGIFFLASDTLLAYNKFYAPLPATSVLVLGTYYAALFLIAHSVAKDGATN
jgi:uncharacterized membrane protein YhhN